MADRRSSALKQQRAVATREALLHGAARVFARVSFSDARLRDIATESGISQGAIYFHFKTKNEIAEAVLITQQEKMTTSLTQVLEEPGSALDKVQSLMRKLAHLIATDEVVQGGITLAGQPHDVVIENAHGPYFEWIQIGRTLVKQGINDDSIDSRVDIESAAELINSLFVGSQVLAGLSDSWTSLPDRVDRMGPYLVEILRRREH